MELRVNFDKNITNLIFLWLYSIALQSIEEIIPYFHRCILFKFAELIPSHRLNYFHSYMKLCMNFYMNIFSALYFDSKFHNLSKLFFCKMSKNVHDTIFKTFILQINIQNRIQISSCTANNVLLHCKVARIFEQYTAVFIMDFLMYL